MIGLPARIVQGIVYVRLDLGAGRPEWLAVADVRDDNWRHYESGWSPTKHNRGGYMADTLRTKKES